MQPTRALLKRSVWKGKPNCYPKSPSFPKFIIAPAYTQTNITNVFFPFTLWKTGPFIDQFALTVPVPKVGVKYPPIRTEARSCMILPKFIGLRFQVHNGKNYQDVLITEDMVGHKLGEFSA
jgi:ribosomal protein S19